MACIGTLSEALEMACGAPTFAFNRIQGAKLINAADIASFTVNPASAAIITMKAGKIGYNVTTVNNALTLNVAMKSQDIMPGAFDVTVTFKQFSVGSNAGLTSDGSTMGVINALARLELVIAVDHGFGRCRV